LTKEGCRHLRQFGNRGPLAKKIAKHICKDKAKISKAKASYKEKANYPGFAKVTD